MNYKSLAVALIFSFGMLSQSLIAMEPDESWGVEIEGHPSIRMSAPGREVLILDLPVLTGLSGKVSGPVVIIENFPNDPEAERNLLKLVAIEADTLVVNRCKYVENVTPFSPKSAKREHLRLILNSEDVLKNVKDVLKPKPKLPQQLETKENKENKNLVRQGACVEEFSSILKMINEKSVQPAQDNLWGWGNTITLSLDKEYIKFSKMRCVTSKYTPGIFYGGQLNTYEPADSGECVRFLKGFITLFNQLPSDKTCRRIKTPSKIIWMNYANSKEWPGKIDNDIAAYVISSEKPTGRIPLNEIALIMDNSPVPLTNEVLSLKIGSLQQLIEGNDTANPISYTLELYQ